MAPFVIKKESSNVMNVSAADNNIVMSKSVLMFLNTNRVGYFRKRSHISTNQRQKKHCHPASSGLKFETLLQNSVS